MSDKITSRKIFTSENNTLAEATDAPTNNSKTNASTSNDKPDRTPKKKGRPAKGSKRRNFPTESTTNFGRPRKIVTNSPAPVKTPAKVGRPRRIIPDIISPDDTPQRALRSGKVLTKNPMHDEVNESDNEPSEDVTNNVSSKKVRRKRGKPSEYGFFYIGTDSDISQNENSQANDHLRASNTTNNIISMDSDNEFIQNTQTSIEGLANFNKITPSSPCDTKGEPIVENSQSVIEGYKQSYSDYPSHMDIQPSEDDETSGPNASIFNQDTQLGGEETNYFGTSISNENFQLNEDESTGELNSNSAINQITSDELEDVNYKVEPRAPNINTIEPTSIGYTFEDHESDESDVISNLSEDSPYLFSDTIDSKTTFLKNDNEEKPITYGDSFSILSSETEINDAEDNFSIKERLYSSDQSENEYSDDEGLDWRQFPSPNNSNVRNILPNMFLEYQPAAQYKSFNYFGKRQFNSSFSALSQAEIINNIRRLIPQGPLYRITSPCKHVPLKHPKYYFSNIQAHTYTNTMYIQTQNLIQFDIDRSKTRQFLEEHLVNEVNNLLFKTGVGNCMQLIFKSWLIYVMGESQNQLWILNTRDQSKSFMLLETLQNIKQIYISNSDKNYVSIVLRLELGLIPFRLSYNEIKTNNPRSIYPRPYQLHSPPLDISFNLNDSSEFFVILKNGEFYKGEISLKTFDKLGEIVIEEGLPLRFTRKSERNTFSQLDAEFYLNQENINRVDNAEESLSENDSSTENDESDYSQSEYEPDSDTEESHLAPRLNSNDKKPDKPTHEPLSTTRIRYITNNQLIIFNSSKLYKVRFSTAKTLINPINLPYPTDCLLSIEVIGKSDIALLTRKYLMILSLHDPKIVQHVRAHLVPASPNSFLSISKLNEEGRYKKQYLITIWSTFDTVPYSYIFTLCPEASLSQIPFNIPTPHCSSNFREYYKLFNQKFYGFNPHSVYYNKRIGITQTQLDLPQLIGLASRVYSKRDGYSMSIWWLTELGDLYQINLKWTKEEVPNKLEFYNSMQMTPDPYELQFITQNIEPRQIDNVSDLKSKDCTNLVKKLHSLSTIPFSIKAEFIDHLETLVPEMALQKSTRYNTCNLSLIQFMEELALIEAIKPHHLPTIASFINYNEFWRNELLSKKLTKTWFKSPLINDYENLLEFDELHLTSNIESSNNTHAHRLMLNVLDKSMQVISSSQEIHRDLPPPETPKPDTDKPYRFKVFDPKMGTNSLKDFVNRLSHRWGSRAMEDPGTVASDPQPIRNIAYLSQTLPPVSPIHSQQLVYAQTQPHVSNSQQPTYTQSQSYTSNSQHPASTHTQPYSIFSQPPTALNVFGSSTQPAASNLPFTTMSQPAPRSKPVQKKRTRGF